MDHYAGIDVSLATSSVCILDATGRIVREAKVASEPEALVAFLAGCGHRLARIGLGSRHCRERAAVAVAHMRRAIVNRSRSNTLSLVRSGGAQPPRRAATRRKLISGWTNEVRDQDPACTQEGGSKAAGPISTGAASLSQTTARSHASWIGKGRARAVPAELFGSGAAQAAFSPAPSGTRPVVA